MWKILASLSKWMIFLASWLYTPVLCVWLWGIGIPSSVDVGDGCMDVAFGPQQGFSLECSCLSRVTVPLVVTTAVLCLALFAEYWKSSNLRIILLGKGFKIPPNAAIKIKAGSTLNFDLQRLRILMITNISPSSVTSVLHGNQALLAPIRMQNYYYYYYLKYC